MHQLSEMFNVNHFIISQANPHAVMFGTYNTERSVWTHPITGLFNSLLVFLKDQLRGWLTHAVELVGGRRLSPSFGTQRDLGVTVLTQGRSANTLCSSTQDCSLTSNATLSCLKSTRDENVIFQWSLGSATGVSLVPFFTASTTLAMKNSWNGSKKQNEKLGNISQPYEAILPKRSPWTGVSNVFDKGLPGNRLRRNEQIPTTKRWENGCQVSSPVQAWSISEGWA